MKNTSLSLFLLSIIVSLSFVSTTERSARNDPKYKWICTDKNDPSKMSTKDYLAAFNKGPCSPLIVVPAMTAQRLVVDFNCSEAKKNYKSVWDTCGWILPCRTKMIQFWPPDPQWAATYVFGQTTRFKECLAAIVGPKITLDQSNNPHYYALPGMEVRPQWEGAYNFGSVERKESCGFRASNKLMNGPFGIQQVQFNYMGNYWDDFAAMGYRANLTTFMFAYNWLLDAKTIVLKYKFREMAETMFNQTGKKMAVFTHSYGLNVGFEGVMQFNREERARYFTDFVSAAGPWLGTYAPFDYIVGGDVFAGGALGLPKKTLDDAMGSMGVLYTLTQKDTYERFEDSDWVKKTVQLKHYYETGEGTNPFSFMPSRAQLCSNEARQVFETNMLNGNQIKGTSLNTKIILACNFGLDIPDKLITDPDNKVWKPSEAEEFLTKHGVNKNAGIYFTHFNTYNESSFENFGVRTYFIIQNNVPTPSNSKYTKWDKDDSRQVDLASRTDIQTIHGDATVTLMSQLGPALKWALEFEGDKSKNRPVKIMHYCNNMGQRMEMFDHHRAYTPRNRWFDKLKNEKNEYLGIECDCGTPEYQKRMMADGANIGDTCNHVAGVNDKGVEHMFKYILTESEKVDLRRASDRVTDGLTDFVKGLDENYQNQMVGSCMLEKPWFLEDWRKNFKDKNTSFLSRADANWRRRRMGLHKKHANH